MRNKLIALSILLLGLILLVEPALADFNNTDWPYYKNIIKPKRGAGLIKVVLDNEVFANLNKNLSDLRVIDENGKEIAFKLLVEKESTSKNFKTSKIFNNAYNQEGYQNLIVDLLQGGVLHNQIKINTTEKNFQKKVEISGSNDNGSWQLLKSDGYIYDYTDKKAGFIAQDTTVNYPESTFRYLRLKIFSETQFKVSEVNVYQEEKTVAKETSFALAVSQSENQVEKITEILLDLGQPGIPTNRITLVTNQQNFNRPVAVYSSDNKENFEFLANSYIFSLNTPKFVGSNLSISYPETNKRYLKIVVYNGDSPQITFNRATGYGILRRIVFEAEANIDYKLYYGNPGARFPDYDIERLFPYFDLSTAGSAELSTQQINPEFIAKLPPPEPFFERHSYLLPLVLVLSSLFLIFLIIRFVRKV